MGETNHHSDQITFKSGSTASVNKLINLYGATTIEGGATMTGSSRLVVHPGVVLTGAANLGIGLQNRGEVRPGLDLGGFGVTSYEQTASATLRIQLASPNFHDFLIASGVAVLAGALDVDYVGGFFPESGHVFRVLDYASRSGGFTSFVDLTFGPAAGQFLQPLYRTDHLVLYCPLVGDGNYDGIVSGADYTIWADNFGQPGTWADGDFNGDGFITGADYTLWADHFGELIALPPAPTIEFQATAVPEPPAWGVAACCLVFSSLTRWIARSRRSESNRALVRRAPEIV